MGRISLNIELLQGDELFIKSNYLYLEPYAPSTVRKFVFKSITYDKRENIDYNTDIIIKVRVIYGKMQERVISIVNFSLIDYNNNYADKSEDFWIEGEGDGTYAQGVIDIFNAWQNGRKLDWFDLSLDEKRYYISACIIYGTPERIIKKDAYYIDWSLIKEELDIFYLTSIEFLGERRYMGGSIHTYFDCIRMLYFEYSQLTNIKLFFLNRDKISDPTILKLYEEVKEYFKRFKITVIGENEF